MTTSATEANLIVPSKQYIIGYLSAII